MVEKFIMEIVQRIRSKKVAIFLSSEIINIDSLKLLSKLREKLKELGEVKHAMVLYEGKLPESHFQLLREAGFSNRIVPSNLQLNFIIEVYDAYLREDIDTFIVGIEDEAVIPLLIEVRKNSTVYALGTKDTIPISIKESSDGVIFLNSLDDFSFDESSFPEMTIEGSSAPQGELNFDVDLANIGPTSDKMDKFSSDSD